jgi:hypothetical protein
MSLAISAAAVKAAFEQEADHDFEDSDASILESGNQKRTFV